MKIGINEELDNEVYESFREGAVGGVDFGKKIRDAHPRITLENHRGYIRSFYAEHGAELAALVEETKRCFEEIEKPLFDSLRAYFGKDPGEREYACYLSIFDCNPRFIETGVFQVYYKRPYDLRKEVIAHELSHFAFYEYCFGLGIKDSKELWELSEIFNVIFLNLPPLRSALGAEELLFYPDLKEKLEITRKIWEEGLPAADFIRKSLKALGSGEVAS